jgi:hypothetical protein
MEEGKTTNKHHRPTVQEILIEKLKEHVSKSEKCRKALEILLNDGEVNALLEAVNIAAVGRLRYNDHGKTHSIITSLNALKILDLLYEADIQPNTVKEKSGDIDDARVTVLLAAYLHDLGHIIHRERHYQFSLWIAKPIIERILKEIYGENIRKRIQILANTLHAIYAHDKDVVALTVEAGIIGVADATDMAKGRARIPFALGEVSIHSISALAIDYVEIKKGKEKPVRIEVHMSNSSGIFQIQELLQKKLKASNLDPYIEVVAKIKPEERRILRETEIRIV